MVLSALLWLALMGTQFFFPLSATFGLASLEAAAVQAVGDPTQSYVFAAPQTVPAGGTAVVTLVVRDSAGNALPGSVVTFAVASGSATLSEGPFVTGPSGQVSVLVTAPGVGEAIIRGHLGASTGDPAPTRGEVTVTFAGSPLAPTNMAAVGTNGQVSLSWTPADPRGMPVSDYRVQYRVAGTSSWTTYEPAGSWVQQGTTFMGTPDRLEFGHRVASSADGQVMAMTDHTQPGTAISSKVPLIRVSAWNSTTDTWEPRGAPFSPEQPGETLSPGKTVTPALSADGRVLAAGIEGAGVVRVWAWDGTSWLRRGSDLGGSGIGQQRFGDGVVLSADGSRVAISEPTWTGPLGTLQGRVQVFQWTGSTWTQIGQTIVGSSADAYAGQIALSQSGQVLAVGEFSYNAPGTYDVGLLRVFAWNKDTSLWEQRGSDFLGARNHHYLGDHPSLSASGDVLAFEASSHSGSILGAGEIRVFDWSDGAWVQRGTSIFGTSDYELLGAPWLSADGGTVFAAADSYEDLEPPSLGIQGYVRAFSWNGAAWAPKGQTIFGSQRNEYFGEATSASGDVRQITIGVPSYESPNDVDVPGIGRAIVYRWSGSIGPSSVTVPALVNGTSYEFRVAALSPLGQSTFTAPVTAAPYPPATQLTVTDVTSVQAGSRAAYVVTRRDAGGSLTSPGTAQTVYLTATGSGGAFYDAASGGSLVTSVTIAAGQSAATVYFQATTAGDYTVTASDASPANGATGLADASDTLAVTPGTPTQLTLTDTTSVVAGARAAYTVTRRDAQGNAASPGTAQTVYLTATGSGGAFYDAASGGSLVTSVTIAAGQSAATVYFVSDSVGAFTLTASDATPANGATGLADASDAVAVTVDPASLAIIAAFDGTNTVPSEVTYQRAGVTGVSASVIGAVNSAVARLASGVTDTTAEAQQVVDAYLRILAEANGAAADATPANPTTADYAAIGATTAAGLSASGLLLLNDVIGQLDATAVDTVAEIEALAASAARVMTVAAGGSPSPALSVDDLLRLGVSGVDPVQLPFIVAAIGATPDDGSALDTVSKLRIVVADTAPVGVRLTGPASARVGEAVPLTMQVVDSRGRASVLTSSTRIAFTGTVSGTTFEPAAEVSLPSGTRELSVVLRTPAAGTQQVEALWLQAGGSQRDPNRTSGQWSLTIARQSQSVTFAPIDVQGLGTQRVSLVASASSGLPMAFTSLTTTVCQVSGAQVTLTGAGVCTVRASQPGDATYEAAAPVDRSFTVTQAQIGFAPGTVSVEAAGGGRVVVASVTPANTSWVAASSAAWVTTTSTGVGNGEVALRIAPNPLPVARTATISMGGSSFTVTQGPRLVIELRTAEIVGDLVTVQWRVRGGVAAGYVVTLGTTPGTREQQYAAGSAEVLTFVAPVGRFYLRVYDAADTQFSNPSNELLVLVKQPQAPTAPVQFTTGVSGTAVSLAWTPTFDGGEPEQIWVEVSGSASTALPVGRQGQLLIEGAPAGTYSLRLWAENTAGRSALTAPVTITIPGQCTAAPAMPDWLVAGVSGRRVSVLWEHGAGPAPVDYVVTASGVGSVPTGGAKRISGELPPGTYDITVRAVNACGSSAATPPHRVTVAP